MSYTNEAQMSMIFHRDYLSKLPSSALITSEIQAPTGIPDFMVLENTDGIDVITTYELKLVNWKRALRQAFRSRTFSNMSFVVMDESCASPALRNLELFQKYNVGLATFSIDSQMIIHYQPNIDSPFSEQLHSQMKSRIQMSESP